MCEQNESPRDEAATKDEIPRTESDASESITPQDTYPSDLVHDSSAVSYHPSSHFC